MNLPPSHPPRLCSCTSFAPSLEVVLRVVGIVGSQKEAGHWLALLCHVTHVELDVLWRCIEDTEGK